MKRLFAVAAALAVVAGALTACGTKPAATVPVGTVVMIIRHGEKPDKSNGLTGYDENGKEDNSSLTEEGWNRARSLTDVFAPSQGAPRAGLATPKAIFAAGANSDGEGERTRETVSPLAKKLNLPVNTDFGKGDESSLVARALSQPGPTLICWQHGEIPAIVEAFKGVNPAPPTDWPDDRFDVIWTLTRTATGWDFAQIPEMSQPGDDDTPIGS